MLFRSPAVLLSAGVTSAVKTMVANTTTCMGTSDLASSVSATAGDNFTALIAGEKGAAGASAMFDLALGCYSEFLAAGNGKTPNCVSYNAAGKGSLTTADDALTAMGTWATGAGTLLGASWFGILVKDSPANAGVSGKNPIGYAITVPVQLVQGDKDTLVDPTLTAALYGFMHLVGTTNVSETIITGGTHSSAVISFKDYAPNIFTAAGL